MTETSATPASSAAPTNPASAATDTTSARSGPALTVKWQTVPKLGRSPEENEDSVAVDVAHGRFAVSDGASTAARPEVWSRLLVDAFADGVDPLAPDTLTELRDQWRSAVHTADLPWYALAKLAEGSAATFLGLRIDGDRFVATGVGDSCLFHVRRSRLALVGPVADWTRFSRFPSLVLTIEHPTLAEEEVWTADGEVADGDMFLLATDAVARHLLRAHAEGGALLPVHDHVDAAADFAEFVARERERGLANDDCTVCVVLA